ncbi:methyltransferase [Ferrimonas lipolytica]|uniref:Methyltransferase n=1 Tax=Ferrimonas lipolytica TaxID=2724191 RepID=A0A6H1UC13_9GAMM|nr:methyltransferase [Ferrimonas lipolytica]QIZ76601.1 methyltransferase [Ferrimonas lipolytica]
MVSQWQQRITQLVHYLGSYRSLWHESVFNQPQPLWLQQHPQLADWLLALPEQQVIEYDLNQAALITDASVYLNDLYDLAKLSQFDLVEVALPKPINPRQFAHIPGRKLEQIQSFVAALPPYDGKLLEWCSGKGHLGRLFAQQHGNSVVSLEYDKALCDSGTELAARAQLPQRFICQDALATEAADVVQSRQRAVALHACGDLHRQLLHHGVNNKTEQLAISPCCYHLTTEELYQPLSNLALELSLPLDRSHLRLAVLQTKTAPERVRRLRATEVSYRLGFKRLLASINVLQQPLPSCGKAIFSQGFESFCRWACAELRIELNTTPCWDELELQGQADWQRQRRLDLARQLFRPALESYLVLDRALYLAENGYQVSISRFCQDQITPRNILIFAKRHSE